METCERPWTWPGLASDSLFGNPSCWAGYRDSVAPLQTRLNLLNLKECRIVLFYADFYAKGFILRVDGWPFCFGCSLQILETGPTHLRGRLTVLGSALVWVRDRLFSTAVSTSVLTTYFSSCFFLWWALTQTPWEFSSVIGSFLLDPGSIPLYLDSITKTVFGFALEAEPRVGCLHTPQSSALGLQ